jgi:hypothetical protein
MTSDLFTFEELQALRRRASAERTEFLAGMAKAALASLKRRFIRPQPGGFHAAH